MKRTINSLQKFECAACEAPTIWFFLKKGLCPGCYILNVSKLKISVTVDGVPVKHKTPVGRTLH
jgi:hypothetical protein